MEQKKNRDHEAPRQENEAPELTSYIGPGNDLSGTMTFAGKTVIMGSSLKGTITATDGAGQLYFGPQSEVDGEVEGKNVTMAGKMRGSIEAPRVTMTATARFSGDIYTKKGLTVETGAKMNAKIKMKGKRKKKKATPENQ